MPSRSHASPTKIGSGAAVSGGARNITNLCGGTIMGDGFDGIQVKTGAVTIDNFGSIGGTGNNGVNAGVAQRAQAKAPEQFARAPGDAIIATVEAASWRHQSAITGRRSLAAAAA